MKIKSIWVFISFISILFFSGCASSIKLAPLEDDLDAKNFSTEENMTVLYIVQNGGYGPRRALFQIILDGKVLGSLSGRTFHRLIVPPGTHTLVATSPENEEALKFVTDPTDLAFVGVSSMIGWTNMRVGTIQILGNNEGIEAVKKAKLAYGIR